MEGVRATTAVAVVLAAAGAYAQDLFKDGHFTFSFPPGACMNASISTPEWRRGAIERSAKDEYRTPTAAELAAVGTAYVLLVWTDEEMQCRGVRPKEVVITDPQDSLRARFPLTNVKAAVLSNAMGAKGDFYTGSVVLTRADMARAFGVSGILHVLASDGKKSAPFTARAVAEDLKYETPGQREARLAGQQSEDAALKKAEADHMKAAAADAMAEACTGPEDVRRMRLTIATVMLGKLSAVDAAAVVSPHAGCVKAFIAASPNSQDAVAYRSYLGE
jgi:hypothetical protein